MSTDPATSEKIRSAQGVHSLQFANDYFDRETDPGRVSIGGDAGHLFLGTGFNRFFKWILVLAVADNPLVYRRIGIASTEGGCYRYDDWRGGLSDDIKPVQIQIV